MSLNVISCKATDQQKIHNAIDLNIANNILRENLAAKALLERPSDYSYYCFNIKQLRNRIIEWVCNDRNHSNKLPKI